MSRDFSWLLPTAAALAVSYPAHSLEKRAVRYDSRGTDDWSAASTCVVSYWNVCTAWVWILNYDDPTVQLGVNVQGNGGTWSLVQSEILYWHGSVPGRGFTGTISTYAADANGCPVGPAIETQPFLPPEVSSISGIYTQDWGGVAPLPNSFVIAVTYPGYSTIGGWNPLGFGTEFGTVGPTGPDACGSCYPAGRQSHSYIWRLDQEMYCPGLTLVEGQDCEVELLWDLSLSCTVDIESSTWGSIKSLYR